LGFSRVKLTDFSLDIVGISPKGKINGVCRNSYSQLYLISPCHRQRLYESFFLLNCASTNKFEQKTFKFINFQPCSVIPRAAGAVPFMGPGDNVSVLIIPQNASVSLTKTFDLGST